MTISQSKHYSFESTVRNAHISIIHNQDVCFFFLLILTFVNFKHQSKNESITKTINNFHDILLIIVRPTKIFLLSF